jgi:hypothetical protein
MVGAQPAATIRVALADTGRTLRRLPGREVRSGLHEVKEFGPALRSSLIRGGVAIDLVALNHAVPMANWNRPTSQIDLVVFGPRQRVDLAAELKAWDIGHQLFDLAKACCLLATGASAAFLMCVAQRASDFDRLPGGELFPAVEGESREHDFLDLIATHRPEWSRALGRGGPEPTIIPTVVTTTAVSVDVPIEAYPGHAARAVQVAITDPAPIALTDGWPQTIGPPK